MLTTVIKYLEKRIGISFIGLSNISFNTSAKVISKVSQLAINVSLSCVSLEVNISFSDIKASTRCEISPVRKIFIFSSNTPDDFFEGLMGFSSDF